MTSISIKPDIVFSLSQLKFSLLNNGAGTPFNLGFVASGDKVKIRALPPGVLPDKMVIDLGKMSGKIQKIIDILYGFKKKFDLSNFTDLGNDIDYAIKELPNFKSKLRLTIDDAAAKMVKDMFDNVYAGFDEYRYVEILFSQDYKKIISVRLLGSPSLIPDPRNAGEPKRFVIFNFPNENFDINIVNLIYKADLLIKEFTNGRLLFDNIVEGDIPKDQSNLNFVVENFVPAPPIHEKPSWLPGVHGKDLAFLENIAKEFFPKTYNIFLAKNDLFSSLSTQQQMADISQRLQLLYSFENSPLLSALKDVSIVKGLKEGLNPLECLKLIWFLIFGNLDICGTIQEISKTLIKLALPDPGVLVKEWSVIGLFDGIDNLPKPIKELVYLNFNNEQLTLNLTEALITVQDYVSSLPQPPATELKCKDPTSLIEQAYGSGGLSSMFKTLKQRYPDYYGDIEKLFNDNFSRDALVFIIRSIADLLLAIDYCNFGGIDFQLPTFKITDLWFDFSISLENIFLGLICELLGLLLDVIITLLSNINRLEDFFNQFTDNEENLSVWEQYLDYALYLLLSSDRASTKTQSVSDLQTQATLSTTEGQGIITGLHSETLNPVPRTGGVDVQPSTRNASDFCEDVQNSRQSRVFSTDEDIEYELPEPPEAVTLQIQDLTGAAQTLERQEKTKEILDKIKYFTYCKKYDFFATNDVVDFSTIDALRTISSTVPPLYTTPTQIEGFNENLYDKRILQSSLKAMFRQINTVLSPRELSSLLTGTYTEEVAAVVRIIAKTNFPDLTQKVDPIKYFTMLGKVVGRTVKQLEYYEVFGDQR